MLVYWLMLIGSVAIGYPLCKIKYGKEAYCLLAGIALFLVQAIRLDVGYDYNLYGGWFNTVQFERFDEILTGHAENGFIIPMKLLSMVTNDFQVMFVIIGFIVSVGVMLYSYRYSPRPYLSVFFFLASGAFFNCVDFMRQIIAAIIIMYAFRYIKSKQFFRFAVLAVFASCIHTSALFMIPFYFILMIPMNWITLGSYTVISCLCFAFSNQITYLATMIASGKRHQYYADLSIRIFPERWGANPIYCFTFAVMFLLVFLLRKRLVKRDKFNNVYLNCMYFTFLFEFFGLKDNILGRLNLYFILPAVLVLLPRAMDWVLRAIKIFIRKKDKTRLAATVLATVLVISGSCYIYHYMIVNNYNGVYPYRTIYSEEGEAK